MNAFLRWLAPAQNPASGSDKPFGMVEHKSSPLQSLFTHSDPANAHWTASDYASLSRRGFMGNPIVYRCIRLISETAAAVPMLVYDGAQEIDDHPLLSLLRRPNERQSGKEFMETLIGHLLVSGNAYLELIRLEDEPRELHLLRPDRVKVVADSSGWVQGYDYQANGQHQVHSVVPGLASPVLHLTLFHPLDDHYGFAPLEAALMALDTHNAASQWNKALLDNSARPSGALVYAVGSSEHLSDDQFARLKSELEDGYTGAKSAGRPLLLEGGLDWKAMGYSPKDMDFVDGRHAAARDIALAFGVPPMLLGIPGDNTYSNYQEANRAFTRQTLLPMINRTLDAINHWFRSDFGDDVQLRIDDDRIEGLSMEREAFWSRINGADFLSQSEKREAVGYSPDRPESENDEEALS